ncbi:unnamed protein product [Vicia faba]|uniref:Uncharacterized protein n=1 Tax=Vicia faba TaxID=3906 RepID=A0AAV1AH84_VICFA|nr:unnamed protein product [Vicia faba]
MEIDGEALEALSAITWLERVRGDDLRRNRCALRRRFIRVVFTSSSLFQFSCSTVTCATQNKTQKFKTKMKFEHAFFSCADRKAPASSFSLFLTVSIIHSFGFNMLMVSNANWFPLNLFLVSVKTNGLRILQVI